MLVSEKEGDIKEQILCLNVKYLSWYCYTQAFAEVLRGLQQHVSENEGELLRSQ